MQLFDTARQEVVPFEARDGRVGIYVCGITPYDSAHLGHAFVYHVFDVLQRRFRDAGLGVRSVRNVTDVDDDILRVARERNVDFRDLAREQGRMFEHDMAEIGLLPVDAAPRATEHVDEMVDLIARLVAGGYAYAVDGWIFFDSGVYPDYGRLSRLDHATMLELSRERGADPDDPRKRHPLDFVLWQSSGAGEPSWPSPWGRGRPGWHIECTVMSTGALGHPIDIHGGGDDLIFPHHESEIAQAEAGGIAPYVRHWTHVAMVKHEGVKMSKSLGNLVFVRDLVARVPGAAVRLLLASHHYRESWGYDDAEVGAAAARHRRYLDAIQAGGTISHDAARRHEQRFFERLDDDLDTPGALRELDAIAQELSESSGAAPGTEGQQLLGRLLGVLGAETEAVPA
ncbi:MAG TPA: cysteine--tRNA ligase [Candidatus Dormibacteraeota bacterium]|jgi:L-cysteine:1D-myo-inositol 2-amino-2-deoxy-alpha-D-glucopyranoside ligase|nr:cysteine--tRNA ligase [Candidatus Dormibacteraeota bacterium]